MKNYCLSKNFDTSAEQVKVLGEPSRLKIICLLKGSSLCVCEIFKILKLPQNLVSHHLKILLNAGLVINKREGKKIIYSLNQKLIKNLQKELKNILSL